MSYWNYRVLKRTLERPGNLGNEIEFGFYEVYYEDDGTPHSCSAEPASPYGGDSLEELQSDLNNMSIALNKPVLNYEDFVSKAEKDNC